MTDTRFDIECVATKRMRLALSDRAAKHFHHWMQLGHRSLTKHGTDEWLDICSREALLILRPEAADLPNLVVGGFASYEALCRLQAHGLAPAYVILRRVDWSEAEQIDMIDREFSTLIGQLLPRPRSEALPRLVRLLSPERCRTLFGVERPTLRHLEKLNGFGRRYPAELRTTIFEKLTRGE